MTILRGKQRGPQVTMFLQSFLNVSFRLAKCAALTIMETVKRLEGKKKEICQQVFTFSARLQIQSHFTSLMERERQRNLQKSKTPVQSV